MKKGLPLLLALLLMLLPAASAQTVLTCGSCPDCSAYLQNGTLSTGDILSLATDIIGQDGDCIYFNQTQGITLDCGSHIVSGDWDSDGTGIRLNSSDGNTVTGCIVTGFGLGVGLSLSDSNLIYDNLFNNTANFQISSSSGNSWNATLECSSGYSVAGTSCVGGNLWSDSDGNGFSDSCADADSDGICDSPYTLGGPDTDFLPLTLNPFVDTEPPLIQYVFPTPPDSWSTVTMDWAFINASSDEPLDSCILNWNGTNESVSASAASCGINKTSLANGFYSFIMYATDSQGNMNATPQRSIEINISGPSTFPTIDAYSVYPPLIFAGDDVLIGVNASDDQGIDDLRASITYPNGTAAPGIVLLNNGAVSWKAPVPGTYSLTITAEDADFNAANATGTFTAGDPFSLTLNVTDFNSTGLSADLEIFSSGTSYSVFTDHESDGQFSAILINHTYDMAFLAFDDTFGLTLRNVTITPSFNGSLDLLDYYGTDGFEYIVNVETDYPIGDALVRIYYGDLDLSNETMAAAYACEDWDLSGSFCDDDWELIDDFTNNEDDEYIEFAVSGFSAFAVREDSYCGDGWCGPGETKSSCSEDCSCNPGETRSCSAAHYGICSSGTETCADNIWSGCPSSRSETCNRADDDCDGIIDNVNGGTSLSATKCGCYGDATPSAEQCNGIDDNCDGIIDNNADCCTTGQTRDCGPSTTEGACQKGTSSCVGGTWGTCQGSVSPAEETCGDSIDNDCDGQTDEGCAADPCSQGEIASRCLCEGSARTAGYCCSGIYYSDECPEFPFWWILVAAGVAILAALVFLLLKFRKDGKELTWEELMNKYRPSSEPPPPG